MLGIALADLLNDDTLDDMIQETSDEASRICRRKFAYDAARLEFYGSYDQIASDPNPQYVWLDAPVDPDVPVIIKWAMYNQHDTVGVSLDQSKGDFTIDYDSGLVTIRAATGLSLVLLPVGLGLPIFQFSPTGFRVNYGGGYPDNTPDVLPTPDPTDDFGVTQVPSGLKRIVAAKVAYDYSTIYPLKTQQSSQTNVKVVSMTEEEFRLRLKPYRKKDQLF